MIPTPPVQERSTRCSCPPPDGLQCHRPRAGTMVHRSWTGTHQPIARLRCTVCGHECAERDGTWLARSPRPAETVGQLLPCQRWGVCDAGTAARCAGELQTRPRFQRVAAPRTETHHRQAVQEVAVQGVQWDAAPATLRPNQVEWVQTAWAMGNWCLLWGDLGPRTQEQAAMLVAQVVARARELPVCLTDGWKAATAALLQVGGVLSRPRRRGQGGRQPSSRLVVEGSRRVGCGGPRRFVQPLRLRKRGETIQTACMERWSGTRRGVGAPVRRRTRCWSWSRPRHRGRVWLRVSL